MKYVKKLICYLLVFCMTVSMLPLQVFAEDVTDGSVVDRGVCGENLTWTLDDNGLLIISGTGAMYDYELEQAAPWFGNSSRIIALEIKNGVTSVGDYAFWSCDKLELVDLPDSVVSIGNCAFMDCESVISIDIPDKVTFIGGYAFQNCLKLTSVVIPAGVTELSDSVFSCCEGLASIVLPESLTSIGETAFYGCCNLESISIPNGVTLIDKGAFYDCAELSTILFPDNIASIGEHSFGFCKGLEKVQFEGNFPAIASDAFLYCDLTAYYPAGNNSWLADVMQNYGGTITWISYGGACDNGHTEVIDEAVPATCTKPGKTEGKHCSVCGETLVAQEEIAAGHNIVNDVCTDCGQIIGTCGKNLTWVLDDEGTLTISGEGDMENYDDQNPSPWFDYRTQIKTAVINSGVTSIGDAAFSDFNGGYNLSSVIIGDDVTSIGDYAFWCCGQLTAAEIGDSVEHLGDYMFGFCTNLTSITIPDSVTSIGKGVFSNCNNLTEIIVEENNTSYSSDANGVLFNKDQTVLFRVPVAFTGTYVIPNSVTEIGEDAFGNCDGLASVMIPDGITKIGEGAFFGCDNIVNITIPNSVTGIEEAVFGECRSLSSVVIPDSVVSIERYAFSYCESLTSVTIGNGVTSIGVDAFAECNSLVDVYYDGTEEQWSKVSIGSGNDCLINAKIHFEKIEESENITGICGDNLTWVFNNGVLKISGFGEMFDYSAAAPYPELSEAPWKHLDIRSVIINEGVTSIGSSAFANSDTLSSVLIPGSVTSIGDYAFHFCSKLSNLTLSEGVVTIGDYAFYDCRNLLSITIPSSVESIGEHAFADCNKLSTVTLSEGITSIGDYAFISCESLSNIAIPGSITHIGFGAFSGCFNLEGIWVATSNANYASDSYGVLFSKDKQTLIQVPCALEEAYTIPVGVILIEKGAFHSCDQLNNILIPTGVTSIGNMAFSYCTNLTIISIPESITNIGDSSFSECINLADVFYSGTREKWEKINIGESNEYLINATLHYNSTGIDDESSDSTISKYVRYFTNWDAEKQIAYFDGEILLGYQVTEETDLTFLENVDSLVGQYVLAETRSRNDAMMAPDTLLSIKPVESKTGTVNDADDDVRTITIDGFTYDFDMSQPLYSTDDNHPVETLYPSTYVEEFVLYHIYDGDVVGIEILETIEGKLTYWNDETNEIHITHDDQTSTAYALSELADGATVELLGETGYFEYDVSFAFDSNLLIYKIERIPVLDFADGYVLMAYFDRRYLALNCKEEMDCVCVLYYDGLPQDEWNKPAITTSDENTLSVTSCEKVDSGYCLKIKGIQPGTAVITVTDGDSGVYVDFTVEVNEDSVTPYSYLIDEVPIFYPDVFGDRKTQTNFYNVNGLYVNDFPEKVYKFNGMYQLSFNVYNSSNMYGSVDIYDENGNWHSSQRINKHTSITGLWDTAKGAFFFLYDGLQGNTISYTANSTSTLTRINIEVPEGGYFTISNNFVESPGAYIYNVVDFMMMAIDTLIDLVFSSKDVEEVQQQTINQILQTPEAYKTFLGSFKDIANGMIKETTKKGYGDAVEALALSAFDLFEDMQFDFVGVVELTCGSAGNVAVDIFKECTHPAIGAALKGIFTINKYLDRLYQVKDVFNSENKPYIRLYTHEATGGLTISGVSVEHDKGVLPDNAVLQVFRIANTETPIVSDEGLVADQYELYNIFFTTSNKEMQPNGKVTIKIPVPDNYNEDKTIVLHQQDSGSWLVVESVIEDGFVVFEVDHFSCFAVADISNRNQEHTHTYSAHQFVWSENNACTVVFTCTSDDDTQTVECSVTKTIVPASENEDGKIIYIATVEFNRQTYTDTKTVTIPATGHVTHTAGTEWMSDGTNHWHKCTGCDEKLDVATHSGGTATCTKKAVCAVCGVSYGELASHDYKTAWDQGDSNGHWHECKNCSAHDTQIKHTPGVAATETKAQTCTVCGYVITPELGHTCTAGSKWYSNGTYHWHLCTSCGAWVKTSYHSYSSDTDETCNVCGYTRTVTATEPTEETEATVLEITEETEVTQETDVQTSLATEPTEREENEIIFGDEVHEASDSKSSGVSGMLIVTLIIVMICSLVGVVILLIYRKRKK